MPTASLYGTGQRVRGYAGDIGSALERVGVEATSRREAQRRAEEQRLEEQTLPIRQLIAGLFAEPEPGMYRRGERGSLVSSIGSDDDLYQPSNEELAALFDRGPAQAQTGMKEAGPIGQQPYGPDDDIPEGASGPITDISGKVTDLMAGSRRMGVPPGTIQFALGKGPLQRYDAAAGGDQVRGAEGSGFGREWASAGGGEGSFNVGAATPNARPELQGRVDVAGREMGRKDELAGVESELELEQAKRRLERTKPIGGELPPLTGQEALEMQIKAATQEAKEAKRAASFQKLQRGVQQLEMDRATGRRTPEGHQNALDMLMRLYAADVFEPKFLPTKPREELPLLAP